MSAVQKQATPAVAGNKGPRLVYDPTTGLDTSLVGTIRRVSGTLWGGGRITRETHTLYIKDVRETPVSGKRVITINGTATDGMQEMSRYFLSDVTSEEVEVTFAEKRVLSLLPMALAIRRVRYHDYIGADPELFVERDGALVPAFEFLGPKNPSGYYDGDDADVYWDGYQAEFAFAPRDCMDGLVSAIGYGLWHIQQAARKKFKDAKLSTRTTFDVPYERLVADDPKYVAFGCNPSLNVYGEKLPKPQGIDVPFRSSGGHLHFSVVHKNLIPQMVKELDRILGVIGVTMFQYYDDPRRRMLYGRAGEYRQPKYGFEYRTLSSAWTIHPGIVQFVYEMARHILGVVIDNGGKPASWWDVTEEEARDCINTCDVGKATALLLRNREGLTALLKGMPHDAGCDTLPALDGLIDGAILNGVHTALLDPDSYSRDWTLDRHERSARINNRTWTQAFQNYTYCGRFDG
jgi:hypothetical protein